MEKIDVVTVDQSIKKIAKGAGIIFAGTVVGMIVQIMNRILIVRSISMTDYGIFSLGLVFFGITGILSQGGFHMSVPRFLGYYRGKKDESRIKGVITSSFRIQLLLGVVFALILFAGAGYIEDFYQMEGLKMTLQIVAVGIPLFDLISVVITIFKGFDNVHPTLYFHNIMLVGLRFVFLLAVVIIAPSLQYVLAAYIGALAGTAAAAGLYYKKNAPVLLAGEAAPMGKELLLFSLPLFGTVFLGQLMRWTDVLMLGYFTSADVVGLYNGAVPICGMIPIFLSSAGVIFVPVLSALYSQGLLSEMKKTYAVVTKWIFSATLPFFLVVFIFPHTVLTFFFGNTYQGASTALRILSVGYMVHVSMGPIGQNLVICGRPRLILGNNTVGLLVNVGLNVLLIPRYGINGAAIATAVTYIFLNIAALMQVYRISAMHPFSRNYVKLLTSSLGLLGGFSVFGYGSVSYWILPLVFMLCVVSYVLIVVVTKSFDREDIVLLKTLEKRTGLNLTWLKRILSKFI